MLTDLQLYIPRLIESIADFLTTGINFYIMGILILAIVVGLFIKIFYRR